MPETFNMHSIDRHQHPFLAVGASALVTALTVAALNCAVAPAAAQQTFAAPALGQAGAEKLPGGATSLVETYESWTVSCRIVEGRKVCSLTQVRGNQQTGQRSFAIELMPPRDGKTEGTLVLPFGLALSAAVKLTLDDKPLGQTIQFSTCVPNGCLVPVSFPTVATDAMKKAKALTVTATPTGTSEPTAFALTLDGFSAAFLRLAELAK
jgi:invasion protein IalB